MSGFSRTTVGSGFSRTNVAIIAALLASSGCGPSSSPDSFVPIGIWGGEHASLTLAAASATIEFDCAHGTLPAPIALTDGAFDVPGDYFPERGGPIRIDDPVVRRSARYSGSITGRTMSLRVRLIEPSEDVGTFSLMLGASGRVFKCL